MRHALLLVSALLLMACAKAASSHPVIIAHTEAFNAKDVTAMGRVEHPDIEWFSVSGSEISTEVSGRDNLAEMMAGYFKGSPSVTATLRDWSINGDYISVTETAAWTTKDGAEKSQSSLSVYQLEDGLIRRVWYYPAQND